MKPGKRWIEKERVRRMGALAFELDRLTLQLDLTAHPNARALLEDRIRDAETQLARFRHDYETDAAKGG